MADDPWRVLGLSPGASQADIKTAFKRAAMQCHPDKLASAPEPDRKHAETRFRAIKDAYERLTGMRQLTCIRSRIPNTLNAPTAHRTVPHVSARSTAHHQAAQQYEHAQYVRYQARTRHRYAQAASAAGVGDGLWASHNAGKSFEEAMAAVKAVRAQQQAAVVTAVPTGGDDAAGAEAAAVSLSRQQDEVATELGYSGKRENSASAEHTAAHPVLSAAQTQTDTHADTSFTQSCQKTPEIPGVASVERGVSRSSYQQALRQQ